MTYAEAVKHLEEFYQLQEDKCEKCEQALAVLRRAEPLVAAVENMIASVEGHHASQFEQRWMSKEEKAILRAALAFREGDAGGKEKP